jgi:hypothetical protein
LKGQPGRLHSVEGTDEFLPGALIEQAPARLRASSSMKLWRLTNSGMKLVWLIG